MMCVGSGRPSDDRAGSLAEKAYYELRERLVNRQIPPGSPIYESQICSEIGLGRTPVREAIKRLESEQLVAIYPVEASLPPISTLLTTRFLRMSAVISRGWRRCALAERALDRRP